MAAKSPVLHNVFFICFFLFFLVLGFPLIGQDWTLPDSGYYLDRGEDGEVRFFQRFVWDKEDYVLRYEVVIERKEGDVYRELLRESTTETALTVSLPPGNYRFAIIAYDLLDQPGESSEWSLFEVRAALAPELRNFSPAAFYLDEDTIFTVDLYGRNLSPGAEVWLRHPGSEDRAIIPISYSAGSTGERAQIAFNSRDLIPGTYEIYIRNPGGIDTVLGTFNISFRKPLDIYIAAAYTPLFPLYGDFNKLMEKSVFPLGAATRLSIIPFKRVFGYAGLELTAGWHYFNTVIDGIGVSAHGLGGTLGGVFQKWLPNRTMLFSFRAGAGIVSLLDYRAVSSGGGELERLPSTGAAFQVGGGASFLYLIRKPFFVEMGVDFTHWFIETNAPGYIQPWLGMGWQF